MKPTFSLIINHTPWRPERVEALVSMSTNVELDWPSPTWGRGRGPFVLHNTDYRGSDWRAAKVEWMLAQWNWSERQQASHHVFMTDDLHVAPGFWPILSAMVEAAGEAPAIGLLSNHPEGPKLAARQHRWYCTRSWLVGPAYVLSHAALVELLAWRAEDPTRHMPGWQEPYNDDECINAWIAATGQTCLHPLPTIIEHRDDLESVLGHGDQYSRERVSWRALHSCRVAPDGLPEWESTGTGFDLEAMRSVDYWLASGNPAASPLLAVP